MAAEGKHKKTARGGPTAAHSAPTFQLDARGARRAAAWPSCRPPDLPRRQQEPELFPFSPSPMTRRRAGDDARRCAPDLARARGGCGACRIEYTFRGIACRGQASHGVCWPRPLLACSAHAHWDKARRRAALRDTVLLLHHVAIRDQGKRSLPPRGGGVHVARGRRCRRCCRDAESTAIPSTGWSTSSSQHVVRTCRRRADFADVATVSMRCSRSSTPTRSLATLT